MALNIVEDNGDHITYMMIYIKCMYIFPIYMSPIIYVNGNHRSCRNT